ncbi:MAG: prepilin-type N-terminal cleavage/methylation domain-containing protein [Candidatus Levybacteria bacterium]|nr:prepilin-type N-terminal cleavage/methylation domain-containing protein [Candidatus Levybacteria bacterium]
MRPVITRSIRDYLYKKAERGFTLVEMIISMGLLLILLLVFAQILSSLLDVQIESESTSYLQQDNRFIVLRLTRDIHEVSTIIIPGSVGEQSNTLQIQVDGIDYTYTVQNNNLILTDNSGSYALNSHDTTVSNLSFHRLGKINGKNSIRVQLRLTSKAQQAKGPDIRDIQTTIGLR